jgi:outer membrane protein OmpA-like peptidoglycan-associated protein
MLPFHTTKQKCATIFLALLLAGTTGHTQDIKRTQPVWWFGASGAANFNVYRGTTQTLNNNLTVPAAFHKGNGLKPYVSLLTEYRPNKTWGGMLNIAYDNRGGKFDGVVAPCDCPATLKTNISYVSLEPSLRFAPFSSALYLFAGPTLKFMVAKEFIYTQEKQPNTSEEWSDMRKAVLSAQAGLGIDIPISAPTKQTQFTLSPFASFQTDLGSSPRSIETWSFYTMRVGMALKFGSSKKASSPKTTTTEPAPVIVAEKEVQFSVRAPKAVPLSRQVKETFPFRNSVFFDLGSSRIPTRYVQLNSSQANSFKEEHLQDGQPDNLNNGRSARQMAVYHHILNIMGDRMRNNPESSISLSGASDNNPKEGKLMSENIKQYLVSAFGINPSRIGTEGRDKPVVPSEQPGATKELVLLREGDRRVDITSNSAELMLQVGGSPTTFLKPVQIKAVQADPLDSHVLLNVSGAGDLLTSWNADFIDENGSVQRFGPFTQDQVSIPGKTILGSNTKGDYKIVMHGQTKSGNTIKKESFVSLVKADDVNTQEGLRYTILFDFDKSKTISNYEKFLTDVVTPLIPENSTVIIHGHTDIIGDEKHNHNLSHDRAMSAQKIIERALLNTGKKGIKFETYGFGEDAGMSPFENNLPEERFYNRTVIIDIIPGK